MGAKYIGTETGVVRIGDRPVKPGDIISAIEHPSVVVEALLQRGDFIACDLIDEAETQAKNPPTAPKNRVIREGHQPGKKE